MAHRSRAREVALQLLFQRDQNSTPVPRAAVEQFARDRLLGDAEMTAYCLRLYDGTLAHQSEIDSTLAAAATNWRLSRMQPADRSVLRMGTYELLFDPQYKPVETILNEAVDLARRFGSVESPGFVNGILDHIARSRNANGGAGIEEPAPPAAPPETPTSQ
jgi:N utilization substance protein B